jgi:energy-converting hydrogenase Eha subunit A
MPKRRQDPIDAGSPSPAAAQPETLEAEWEALSGAAREAVESEIAFQKARLGLGLKVGRHILVQVGVALACLFAAILVLAVGLLLALGQSIGFWWATALVMLVLLLALGASALAIRQGFRALLSLISQGADQ